jgi:glyoxylase-like metal-dependent hydrolase (beta-lactamase superfamily II)
VSAAVKLTLLQAGRTQTRERLFGLGDSWRRVDIPALFALLEHPRHGAVLFDTGYSTRFYDATRKFPDKLFSYVTPVKIEVRENARAQLAARGFPPERLGKIIVSHFDPDHIGGLRDFPNARFVCSGEAWRATAGKTGLAALRGRVLTGLLPDDLASRVETLPDFAGPALGPLGPTFDLFGDGSIRLVALPGHAPGMIGALVATDAGARVFLCADACWTVRTIAAPHGKAAAHILFAHDRRAQRQTYANLRRFRDEMPDVQIVPSHCPESFAAIRTRLGIATSEAPALRE